MQTASNVWSSGASDSNDPRSTLRKLMTLGPFLAVLIIFVGLAATMVGSRFLLVDGESVSANRQVVTGSILISLGVFAMTTVFILDASSVLQAVPSFMMWFRSIVSS